MMTALSGWVQLCTLFLTFSSWLVCLLHTTTQLNPEQNFGLSQDDTNSPGYWITLAELRTLITAGCNAVVDLEDLLCVPCGHRGKDQECLSRTLIISQEKQGCAAHCVLRPGH